MKFFATNLSSNKSFIFSLFYFSLVALIVLSTFSNALNFLNYFSKPLLMPTLGLFIISVTKNYSKRIYCILLALFFSWLGDVFLLFEPQHELFFIAGLSAFLIAHLCYIFIFWLDVKNYSLLKAMPFIPLILLLYLGGFLYLLQPNLGEMLLPVSVYAIIICAMLLFAILRYKQVIKINFQLTFIGALLFVLSDSVIAINKFLIPFSWAYSLIIVLYAIGQYFIVSSATILVKRHNF